MAGGASPLQPALHSQDIPRPVVAVAGRSVGASGPVVAARGRDLFVAANNAVVPAFENISDTLCRPMTGGGFAIREPSQ
jgi:hypothetical protein